MTECTVQSIYNLPGNILDIRIQYKVDIMDITLMKKLPTEMLLWIFKQLSYRDLKIVMLVCRRWREIGETPRLWSSLPVIVNTRNMSVIPEILTTRRMCGLNKLWIEATLSKKVSQTIVRHTGLRELELFRRFNNKTITSVLTVICSQGCQVTNLKINGYKMFGVDPGLLARAVTKLEILNVFSGIELTQRQNVAILLSVKEVN